MSRFVPTWEQYKKELSRISSDIKGTIIIRLLSECGIAREELACALRINLDLHHTRGLWIEKAKKVKRGSGYEMRSREVPVNSSLYPLLKAFLDTSPGPFVINRMRSTNMQLALTPRNINTIFDNHLNIPWSPHDCRHFFRSQVRFWMIREKQIDIQVIKEIMGHTLQVHEKYGGESPFEYKLEIVDSVFG
ncbi:MAG: site-specific integrase [Methanosarcinales archaeon]|nr:site-specific integrase [Methanosarcinales archaeon]